MSERVPWPMEPEALSPFLDQVPSGSRTHLFELMALIEVYSTILHSLSSRPLRTFSPNPTVDWIELLHSKPPTIELRTKMQIFNLKYLPQPENLLLGLYYLLLLPIGQPLGYLRRPQNSSEIDCFRQCLKLCYLQNGMSSNPIITLHCLAEEMTETALIDMHSFRHRRIVSGKERSCINLASLYAWLVLGPKGTPTFPLWEAFLDSARCVVDNLPLHEETKRLAISCLDRMPKDVAKHQDRLRFTSPHFWLDFQPLPEAELAERRIRDAKDARLRKVLERSWAMVPLPLAWTEPGNKGESTGSMGIASMPAETDSKEFSIPTCPQASEAVLAKLPQVSDDCSSDAGYMPGATLFSSGYFSGRGSATTHSTSTFSTLQNTPNTTKDRHSITLPSFQVQQWLPTPPGSPTLQRCLGETGSKLTSNDHRTMENAEAPIPPAHQLIPREFRPGLFNWVLRAGKGIANAIEKVRRFEDGLIVKDFDRTLNETQKEDLDTA